MLLLVSVSVSHSPTQGVVAPPKAPALAEGADEECAEAGVAPPGEHLHSQKGSVALAASLRGKHESEKAAPVLYAHVFSAPAGRLPALLSPPKGVVAREWGGQYHRCVGWTR